MPSKPFPTDAILQAREVVQAIKNINPDFQIGDLPVSTLDNEVTQALSLQDKLSSLEAQLTDLRNQRDELNASVWDKVKRMRNGIKAAYGDDSSQYEMVGGTRLSDRKPAARSKTTPA